MSVLFSSGYTVPGGDQPLTHARIAHARNWLTGGTITVSDTENGFFAAAPNNTLTYEKWKADTLPATWEYDHGSSAAVDYCVIGAHNIGTTGASVAVQYYNGASWVDLIVSTTLSSDMPVFAIFDETTAQRWRVSVSGSLAPKLGVIKFGKALQMPRPIFGDHSPLDYGRVTTMRTNESVTGEFLGRTKLRNSLQTSFDWQHITRAWVDANWKDVQLALEEEPFFIAWRPGGYSEVGLCYVNEVPSVSHMGIRDLCALSMPVTARGYE